MTKYDKMLKVLLRGVKLYPQKANKMFGIQHNTYHVFIHRIGKKYQIKKATKYYKSGTDYKVHWIEKCI